MSSACPDARHLSVQSGDHGKPFGNNRGRHKTGGEVEETRPTPSSGTSGGRTRPNPTPHPSTPLERAPVSRTPYRSFRYGLLGRNLFLHTSQCRDNLKQIGAIFFFLCPYAHTLYHQLSPKGPTLLRPTEAK